MEDKIQDAIDLLNGNDYVVIKITRKMKKDFDDCANNEGEKDCLGCSNNICLADY